MEEVEKGDTVGVVNSMAEVEDKFDELGKVLSLHQDGVGVLAEDGVKFLHYDVLVKKSEFERKGGD